MIITKDKHVNGMVCQLTFFASLMNWQHPLKYFFLFASPPAIPLMSSCLPAFWLNLKPVDLQHNHGALVSLQPPPDVQITNHGSSI